MTYNTAYNPNQSGFALIMALIISSVVLSIGLSMLSLTLKQIDLTATARESEIAFQAASAGMECAQKVRFTNASADLQGGAVAFDCLGGTMSDWASCGSNCDRHLFTTDWQNKHIRTTMVILDASAAAVNLPSTYQRPGANTSCSEGDICTYIFAEGFNRIESDISNNTVFTVQREITAEL